MGNAFESNMDSTPEVLSSSQMDSIVHSSKTGDGLIFGVNEIVGMKDDGVQKKANGGSDSVLDTEADIEIKRKSFRKIPSNKNGDTNSKVSRRLEKREWCFQTGNYSGDLYQIPNEFGSFDIMCDGFGEFRYNNGNVYKGEFQMGLRQGNGRYTFRDGGYYEGNWNKNKMNGKGVYMFRKGGHFQGEFVDGFFKRGKLYGEDELLKYEGDFKDNLKDGIGIYYYKSGIRFIGEFEKDHRHGIGLLVSSKPIDLYVPKKSSEDELAVPVRTRKITEWMGWFEKGEKKEEFVRQMMMHDLDLEKYFDDFKRKKWKVSRMMYNLSDDQLDSLVYDFFELWSERYRLRKYFLKYKERVSRFVQLYLQKLECMENGDIDFFGTNNNDGNGIGLRPSMNYNENNDKETEERSNKNHSKRKKRMVFF